MTGWRPQLFRARAPDSVSQDVIENAVASAQQIVDINPRVTPVFSLKHLAYLADVDYGILRVIVSRANANPYRVFRIRKRPSYVGERRFRTIAVPDPALLKTQQWITQKILTEAAPHVASVAYSRGNKLIDAAGPHCGCRWLIKLDIQNFFESISEVSVYRVFRELGFQPLISLEMTRLCTRLGGKSVRRSTHRWQTDSQRWSIIEAYQVWRLEVGPSVGHLPQGAPTSPMLANLAMREFDALVSQIAQRHGLIYTRYADDLAFSTRDRGYSRQRCQAAIADVYSAMGRFGLSPNVTKGRISTPGSRKLVLGLLVDGMTPKLTKDFKAKMRQHLYYLERPTIGTGGHARARGFSSAAGLKNYLIGLAHFARQIEPNYGSTCLQRLRALDWPL